MTGTVLSALFLSSIALAPAAFAAAEEAAPASLAAAGSPDSVSIPGDHNSEMGCASDWDVSCAAALLAERADGVWSGTYDLPAGTYAYKIAIDGSWDENYGAGGTPGGGDISYTTAGGPVTFYYDPITHYATNTAQGPIITAAGSFQSEIGCEADWSPDCLKSMLEDPDGDGTYTFTTSEIPPGDYAAKVTHGLSWDENYGADGQPGGADIGFTAVADKAVTFSYVLATHVLTISTGVIIAPGQGDERAYWVDETTLAWPTSLLPADADPTDASWTLHSSQDASIMIGDEGVTGGDSAHLHYNPAGLTAAQTARFPALAGYLALDVVGASREQVESWLTGELAVSENVDGTVAALTGVQIPGVLDDLYAADAADRRFGASWTNGTPSLAVWAPTAQNVDVLVQPTSASEPLRVPATREDDGTWTVAGDSSWAGATYLYEVRVYAPTTGRIETNLVTDPYSVALTTNSERSLLIDISAESLRPRAWSDTPAPVIADAVDRSIYELHVRDFSIGDTSVPAEYRGTYEAFKVDGDGTKHLRELADAGLNTIHLLPTFDISSIEEDRSLQTTPNCDLASFAPDSPEQQACVGASASTDGYNWGYDPLHYMAPEGSYSTNPEDATRVTEFRDMVGALHKDGLQVVLDVVFNHTSASGQSPKSILDRIVPGYFQRLDAAGNVQTSTCCQNVATEHLLAQKLMVDSLVLWAKEYKVDGFRFDLMGHHSKENMLAVRAALDALTIEKDGVNGKSMYLYGEGWNFGEVADNALFEQATQGQLGGTGIGTFNDRLRDGVHGGTPTRADSTFEQGFGTGLSTDPNGNPINGTPEEQAAMLARDIDWVKIGLAGNLRGFKFVSADGSIKRGDQIDYNGDPAGYADEPDEVINYVDAHDNATLFDILAVKLPQDTSMADRVRMNTLSLATATLSQSPSLWHAGTDLLRSKSLDDNSYDSGDWFNAIDWSGQTSNFAVGLPPKADNGENWSAYGPILANPAHKPQPADIAAATAQAQTLLELKQSTPLFRLGTSEAIKQKLTFPTTSAEQEGVIVMSIDDTVGADRDPALDGALVVFNASPEAVSENVASLAGRNYSLSDAQRHGSDEVVKTTTWDAASATVTVPARTVAVLTAPQAATPTQVDVDLSVAGKKVSGKVVLTAKAVNNGTTPVTLRLKTGLGHVRLVTIDPGKTKSITVNTGLRSVPAGAVTVSATAPDGTEKTYKVSYRGTN